MTNPTSSKGYILPNLTKKRHEICGRLNKKNLMAHAHFIACIVP